MIPTKHQRNKARAKFNKAFAPVLARISERVKAASDERWATALFRITKKKPQPKYNQSVATLQPKTKTNELHNPKTTYNLGTS